MRRFCPIIEPSGRIPPRGGTGARQCLCWTPSSTISSRYRPTLKSYEAWSSARLPRRVIRDRVEPGGRSGLPLSRRKREHGCDLVHILVPRKMIMCADLQFSSNGQIMPALFDHLYREYCRARLAEMRKQLLISAKRHEVPEAICDARDQSDGLTELNSDRPDPPQAR